MVAFHALRHLTPQTPTQRASQQTASRNPDLNIVHVVSGYLPQDSGGTQMQLRDLCCAQQLAGHEVRIFARVGGGDGAEHELLEGEWEGVPVTRLVNNFAECDRFERLYSHPAIDRCFRAYLEQRPPDLVHVHHLTCLSISMVEVAKSLGVPVVMWLSDYWLVCLRGQRIHPADLSICETADRGRCLACLRRLWPHLLPEPDGTAPDPGLESLRRWEEHVRRILELSDALLMPSAFHRDRLIDFGVPGQRSHVVTYGLPRDQLLAEPRGRRPVRRVGFIGTVIPSKGVHVLIEAWNRLGRADLHLDIHGEVTPYHEKTSYLEELEAALEPQLAVHFHGRYENRDLPRILASLDVLVVPSLWWESYCLTAREGALAGLPVVVFELAGLAEAVDEGLALGCAAGDARQLAVLLERLCDDPELRDRMSRKAELVRGISECAAQIESIYRTVLPPEVTLFIPTWNAGPEFPRILRAMLDQELSAPLEVLVIDSGSTDGTVEFLETQPVRLIRIPNREFNHGLTRERAIREARGEIVVLTVQDARPNDRHWLARLVDCFRDPRVAGAYGCQMPRPDASPFIKDRLSHWAAAQQEPRAQEIENRDEFEALAPLEKLGRIAFDNVSSSVRRSVALAISFRERQFGEDIDWAHRVILAGHRIVFEPRSKVVHSHNNSIWYEFKRVYLDHQNLHRLFGVHTVPLPRDVLVCSKAAILHLWNVVDREPGLSRWQRLRWRLRAIPFGISQNLAQYLGARSTGELAAGRPGARMLDKILRRGV